MSDTSPLMMYCMRQDDMQPGAELARGLGYADAHIVGGGIADAVKALGGRARAPAFLIIDVGARGRDALPELDEMAQHCEAAMKVVVIGSVNDISFYRELKNRGILEYFPRPVPAADIRAVMMQASPAPQRAPGQGYVVTCMSSASGDGSSTLAVNLAYCLAEEYKHSTVLVDMDYQFGLIAKSLDLTAPFGIRELFDHPERGLDDAIVGKMLVKYGQRLNIIGSPGELRLLPPIAPDIIRDLINVLRAQFTFVVIDVPHVWTDWTASALKHSDHTIMVAQLWLRSLTHATRLLTAWRETGMQESDVSLIINRSGAKFKEAITAEDFERICRHKIEAHMHNDIKTVANAETHGKTLSETGQDTLLSQQIKQIAQSVALRAQGGEPSEGGGKKKLLSMFDKKTG